MMGRKNMKKILACMLAVMLLLTGCGRSAGEEGNGQESSSEASGGIVTDTTAIDDLKTIADVMALENLEDGQAGYWGTTAIYVFSLDGVNYRVQAEMSEEEAAQVKALDFFAEDYAQQMEELFSGLEISKRENLDAMIPTQEELDQWIGKTGSEMLEAGWIWTWGDLESLTFEMEYGVGHYIVIFDGEVADPAGADPEEELAKLTVRSIEYAGLGDAFTVE